MIEFVRGKFEERTPTYTIVDVNGVGYYVQTSLNTYSELEGVNEGHLLIHYAVSVDVRSGESRHQMVGFTTSLERDIFRQLIAISGISTSIALMVLSAFKPNEFQSIVINGDDKTLTSVKGVGPKMAQKIVHELKGKFSTEDFGDISAAPAGNSLRQEALSALTALGFDRAASVKTINKILEGTEQPDNLETLVKLALKQL